MGDIFKSRKNDGDQSQHCEVEMNWASSLSRTSCGIYLDSLTQSLAAAERENFPPRAQPRFGFAPNLKGPAAHSGFPNSHSR